MTSFILKACIIFKSFLKFIYVLIKLSFPNAPQFFYSLHPFCYVWQNSCILWRCANSICYVTREIMTQKMFISFRDDGSYNWRGKIPLYFSFFHFRSIFSPISHLDFGRFSSWKIQLKVFLFLNQTSFEKTVAETE